jgi:hypothetical protein
VSSAQRIDRRSGSRRTVSTNFRICRSGNTCDSKFDRERVLNSRADNPHSTIASRLVYFGEPALLGSQQLIHHSADLWQCADGCR